ncbi:hypothetical protein T484DRAFT_1755747 [Baffinella frigidus]|nr:hypothetical protein T484DRAFT_1755747 [Cryptophyta sp. CCMP2293]
MDAATDARLCSLHPSAGAAPPDDNSTDGMEAAEKAITDCVASARVLSDTLSAAHAAGAINGGYKNVVSNASPQIKDAMKFLQSFYTTPDFFKMTCSSPSYAPESSESKQGRHALYKTMSVTKSTATQTDDASAASASGSRGGSTTRHCCKCQKTASKIQKVKLTLWGGSVHCGPCRMKAWKAAHKYQRLGLGGK